ncbi:uncharacterized protein BDZ99DRAFT_514743 [Mytilinidion resinicola]|uniref:Uncharacterized protein n=1 Tax=Mytilinidion resinicola TaxID=574789 RepID=A0A6A6Z7A7_9PEZI|nr:uncharacterized protein BDZ99DRAFT_514743 [Mytilinidion resinicola]KAF2816135.1 hypothetical protein BDZ99DRAFT_514743 [Mytilinidion resinicola]
MASKAALLDSNTPFRILINHHGDDGLTKVGETSVDVNPSTFPIETRCSHLQDGSTTCTTGECYHLVSRTPPHKFDKGYVFTCENEACSGHRTPFRRCFTADGLVLSELGDRTDKRALEMTEYDYGVHEIEGWKDIEGKKGLNETMRKITAVKKLAALK